MHDTTPSATWIPLMVQKARRDENHNYHSQAKHHKPQNRLGIKFSGECLLEVTKARAESPEPKTNKGLTTQTNSEWEAKTPNGYKMESNRSRKFWVQGCDGTSFEFQNFRGWGRTTANLDYTASSMPAWLYTTTLFWETKQKRGKRERTKNSSWVLVHSLLGLWTSSLKTNYSSINQREKNFSYASNSCPRRLNDICKKKKKGI